MGFRLATAVSEPDYETGEITDETITARALGNYITTTENLYRASGDGIIERARDWSDVPEDTATASQEFYRNSRQSASGSFGNQRFP